MVPKYECHIKLKTKKDGPVIRSQMRLPHSVKTDIKICVICPPDSPAAKQAREAGAVLVGIGGSKWLTNESDKQLLRAAGVAAAKAGQTPELAQTIAKASPAKALQAAQVAVVAEEAKRGGSLPAGPGSLPPGPRLD